MVSVEVCKIEPLLLLCDFHTMKYLAYTSSNSPSLLQKTVAVVVTVAVAGVALMFSAMLLAVVLVVGATAWAYLWWKTREARRQIKQMQQTMQGFQERSTTAEQDIFRGEVFEGEVIEGEAIRVDETRNGGRP